MKYHGLIAVLFMAMSTMQVGIVRAGSEDEAYYAAMEQMAAEADMNESQMLAEETRVDLEARMGELRRISPTAWATYKRLRPSCKEEIRKAMKADRDIYSVIEMIFDRNS